MVVSLPISPDPASPERLREAASLCRAALTPFVDADWSVPAGDLEWSCRTTLAHLLSALVFYAVNLSTRSTGEPRSGGQTNEELPIDVLLDVLEGRAALLATVVAAAPSDARAAQTFGSSDPAGFVAMGCDEMLVHTDDILRGLGAELSPPADLCRVVLTRLFPWAPDDTEPWETLRWANGRAPLGDRPRLDPEWVWWSRPLAEWDGKAPNAAR